MSLANLLYGQGKFREQSGRRLDVCASVVLCKLLYAVVVRDDACDLSHLLRSGEGVVAWLVDAVMNGVIDIHLRRTYIRHASYTVFEFYIESRADVVCESV